MAKPSKGGGAKLRVFSWEAMIAGLPRLTVDMPSVQETQGVFFLDRSLTGSPFLPSTLFKDA
jgi:hypothetical protein